MSQKSQLSDDKDHGQEEEVIILERPNTGDITLFGFTIAGGSDQPIAQNLTSIFVIGITKNGLADRDKRLRLYDIILCVNDVDYSNIKHQTAVQTLKTSGNKVRLLIRRFTPRLIKIIELKHHNGKLGISISGGIGSEYFKGDYGVFITNILNQSNKQLNIGDRLLEISSAKNKYNLRFVTYNEAEECIRLACLDSKTIKLTVGRHSHLRPEAEGYDPRGTQDKGQYDSYGYRSEGSLTTVQIKENNYSIDNANYETIGALSLLHGNTTDQTLIESFDVEDYQRYENRSKRHLIDFRIKSSVLPCLPSSADLQIHFVAARKINVLQYDHKNLKEIPPEIYSLSNLRTLSLNDNEIQSVSDDIKSLVNLKNLYLSNNQIEFLFSTVFTRHLSKLENLRLNGNRLHSLPATLSYLKLLKQLNLSNNCFFTIPREIFYLYNLQVLDFSGNRITEIKDEIELLEVDELNLNHNQISQISVNISKCKRLKILRLDNNKLRLKSIPTSLLKDSTVLQLSVKGNCFEEKQFQLVEGYDDYERRYTANQRKKDYSLSR